MMNIESTKDKRVWHSGPPPFIGWWNASNNFSKVIWRWWDGEYWSVVVRESDQLDTVAYCGGIANQLPGDLMWNDYWPEDAVCPRVDPNDTSTVCWKGELWSWIDGELINKSKVVAQMYDVKTHVCPDHEFVNVEAVKQELNTLSMTVLRLDVALDHTKLSIERLKELLK